MEEGGFFWSCTENVTIILHPKGREFATGFSLKNVYIFVCNCGMYPIWYLRGALFFISVEEYGYVLSDWLRAARRTGRSLSRRLIYTIFLLNSCIADQKQFLFPERSAASVVRERLSTFFKKSAVCDSVEMGQRKCTR